MTAEQILSIAKLMLQGTKYELKFNQSKNQNAMKTRPSYNDSMENQHISAESRLRDEQDRIESAMAEDMNPLEIIHRSDAYRLCAKLRINPRMRFANKDTAEDVAEFLMDAKKGNCRLLYHLPSDQAEECLKLAESIGLIKSNLLFGETMLHDHSLLFAIII